MGHLAYAGFTTLNLYRPRGLLPVHGSSGDTAPGAYQERIQESKGTEGAAELQISETTQGPDDRVRISAPPIRTVILADNALAIQAIRAGLHKSSAFALVGHADPLMVSREAIIRINPDVVLLDDMDRCERALELIQELADVAEDTRIVVLSSDLDEDWLGQLFEAGATGAISKKTHPRIIGMLLSETLKGHVFHKFASMRPGGARGTAVATDGTLSVDQTACLTSRQLEILRLVAAGSTNCDVARELWVTEQTVKFHLRNIYRKLGVANRTEASHVAHVSGLVNGRPALTLAS
jgi:DNA-binding NarL/FixJ family response regulator